MDTEIGWVKGSEFPHAKENFLMLRRNAIKETEKDKLKDVLHDVFLCVLLICKQPGV